MALERFRYRRDVEDVVVKLYSKFENDAKLKDHDSLEHINELRWLCRKDCNGFHPSGILAGPYNVLYRSHGDLFIVGFLATMCAVILIAATGGEADLIPTISNNWVIFIGFWVASLAMAAPGGSILLGNRCRSWAIARARTCDTQIATILTVSARNATIPTLPVNDVDPKVAPSLTPPKKGWGGIFGPKQKS